MNNLNIVQQEKQLKRTVFLLLCLLSIIFVIFIAVLQFENNKSREWNILINDYHLNISNKCLILVNIINENKLWFRDQEIEKVQHEKEHIISNDTSHTHKHLDFLYSDHITALSYEIQKVVDDILHLHLLYENPEFDSIKSLLRETQSKVQTDLDKMQSINSYSNQKIDDILLPLISIATQIHYLHQHSYNSLIKSRDDYQREHKLQLIYLSIALTIIGVCGVILMLGFVRTTLTNLTKTHKKLTEREQNLSVTLNSIGDAVITTDALGNVSRMNPVAEQLTGWTLNKAKGQPMINIFRIIDAYTRETIENPVEKVINTGELVHLSNHTTLIAKDGTEYQIADTAAPIRNDDGNILGMVLVFNDVTNQYNLREEATRNKKNMQGIMDNTPAIIDLKDTEGRFLFINQQFEKLFHVQGKDIIGKTPNDVFPNNIAAEIYRHDSSVFETEQLSESDEVMNNNDGLRHYSCVKFPLFNEEGEIYALCTISTDITERIKTEREIKRFSRIFEESLNEIYLFNAHSLKFVKLNSAAQNNLGYSMEELIAMTPIDIKPIFTKESFEEMIAPLRNNIEDKIIFETVHERKDKSLYDVEVHLQLLKYEKEDLFAAIILDITKRKQVEAKLNHQANHDSLTGLTNRREFERRTENLIEVAKQNKTEHALCFMDMDQFKVVNDTCGHFAGDEMLRQLTFALKKIVRSNDTLARLGGDEFGVLMEDCSLDDAHRVATSFQKSIKGIQFSWEGQTFNVSVSIGLVPISELTVNLTQLLKDADAACYMAKDKGRNRIHVSNIDDDEIAERHGEMQWVVRINKALDENRFCLYSQTIIPLDTSGEEHYELLIRMLDESGESIPPGAFLPAAERYNLMSKIDNWVIENAFGLLSKKPVFLNRIAFCSINLSGQSLGDKDVLKFIITQLRQNKIAGDKICFEITETAAISNLNTAIEFITTLKKLGCRFALDDFGSGLSSFAYLKNLPVDYLKIDGIFVKDIVDDPIDHAMVKSINEIGQVMGMKTIAEFVENDEIKGMLREIGVNFAQGYGIGHPISFNEQLQSIPAE